MHDKTQAVFLLFSVPCYNISEVTFNISGQLVDE